MRDGRTSLSLGAMCLMALSLCITWAGPAQASVRDWPVAENHGGAEWKHGRLHLWATGGSTRLLRQEPLANQPFLLTYDLFLPPDERAGYGVVVQFPRPEGHAYFWAEVVGTNFSVYTVAEGQWGSRLGASLSPELWYRVELLNRPDTVEVRLIERTTGRTVAEGQAPHDDGSPGRLEIGARNQAAGTKTGAYFENAGLQLGIQQMPARVQPDPAPLRAAWELPEAGGEPTRDGLRLRAGEGRRTAVTSRTLAFNRAFDLSFDLRPSSQMRGALRVTFLHPAAHSWQWAILPPLAGTVAQKWRGHYWRFEIGPEDVALWTRASGVWEERARDGLSWPGDGPLRVKVHNAPRAVEVRILERDGALLWEAQAAHDDGPPVPTAIQLCLDSAVPGVPKIDQQAAVEVAAFTLRSTVPPLPTLPAGKPKAELRNRWLAARWTANDLWIRGLEPQHPPVRLTWSASLEGGPAGVWRRVRLTRTGRRVVEVWRDDEARVELRFTHELSPDRLWLRTRLAAVNREARAKAVYFVLSFEPAAKAGRYTRALSWFQRFRRWEEEPFEADLASHPLKAVWGTREFAWDFRDYGWGSQLCLPLMGLAREDRRSALVFFTDPRVPGTFQRDCYGARWLHRFYLADREGAADEGLDYGDGEGTAYTDLYLGFTADLDWAATFNDFYLAAFPWATWREPASQARLPAGGLSGMSRRFTEEWARRAKAAGFSVFGFSFQHMATGVAEPDYYTRAAEIARRHGLQTYLWDNIMVMPDTQKYDGWVKKAESEPWERIADCDWRNFRDGLVADAEGRSELDCWEGKAGNNSPRFSFGRFALARTRRMMATHGFDGMFLDYYDQATGSDFAHRCGDLPFYPLAVAQMEYTRALADWLHANGKWFVANAPDVAFPVMRFADAVSHDMSDRVKFGLWYKMSTGYRPVIVLANPSAQGDATARYAAMIELGLFNGFSVPWYGIGSEYERYPPQVAEEIAALFARSLPVSWEVGRSRLVAGRPFEWYLYHHPEGDVFVTLRNESDQPGTRTVRAKRRWLGLEAEQELTVSVWTLEAGWQPAGSIQPQTLERGWALEVGAGETRVLRLAAAK